MWLIKREYYTSYHLNDDVWLQVVGQFHQQVNNLPDRLRLDSSGQDRIGLFGSTLPNNFIERQMDYAGLSEPGLVHETRWQTFFYLRDNRMFFLIVFALIIIVQGPRAESGFDRLQQTLPGGKNLRRREMLLLLIFLIFLLIAEFGLDLWLSGIGLDSRSDVLHSKHFGFSVQLGRHDSWRRADLASYSGFGSLDFHRYADPVCLAENKRDQKNSGDLYRSDVIPEFIIQSCAGAVRLVSSAKTGGIRSVLPRQTIIRAKRYPLLLPCL